MAKRKRRAYGSPPEVHRATARTAAKSARFWLRETRRWMQKGDCTRALDALVTAQGMSSVATTERRGAGRGKAMFQSGTLNKARTKFARLCVRR